MDILAQVILFTIPALIVGAVAYLIIDKMLKAENNRRNFELQKQTASKMVPARLQAYERLVLLVERIMPESLLMRQSLKGLSPVQLQQALLKQIREEFEHNITQQLYVSNDAWVMTRNAKESIIQLINTCAAQTPMNASAVDFAKMIIETYNGIEKTPSGMALSVLKAEINKLG